MTSGRKMTREEIWQRIRETSKDEVILAEMKRLGFWPSDSERPSLTEAFVEERRKLNVRLRVITQELSRIEDPEKALKLLHKERKEAALKSREDTKRQHNAERFERASKWHDRQQKEITYLGESLGEGSYAPLKNKALDHARLAKQSLPLIGSALELATAMGITINELRFLCFQRDVSTISHYQRFTIPKKPTGERIISAPMPRLKRAQYWVLANILEKISATDCAHGFVKERNIVTNAEPHVGKALVINMDLENFFPTISYRRVKGIFKQLGYSEEVATLLALVCSEPATDSYDLDGQRYYVRTGEARLPQGAPTSPAISNLLCRRLDKRLRGMASKLGFAYTRYADDLTFSTTGADNKVVKQILWRARQIVSAEGLKVHPEKTHVMRKHQRQEVTGVVVNTRPSVCRKELKKFRALLFQIEKDGPEGKQWRTGSLLNSIEGYANFVAMVDKQKGSALQAQVAALKQKYSLSRRRGNATPLSAARLRVVSAAGKAPTATWWQAQAKPVPVLESTPLEIQERKQKVKADALAAEEALRPKPAHTSSRPYTQTSTNRPGVEHSRGIADNRNNAQRPPPPRKKDSLSSYIWFWLILSAILIFLFRR